MKKALKRNRQEVYYYESNKKIFGLHSKVTGNISGLTGNISSGLTGDISGLTGDISGLIGIVTNITGNIDLCKITEKERKETINIEKLVTEE